jgi:hypothetical protein
MSTLEDIWAEMKEGENKDRLDAKKRSQVLRNGGMVSATAIMNESAPKTKGTKAKNSVDSVLAQMGMDNSASKQKKKTSSNQAEEQPQAAPDRQMTTVADVISSLVRDCVSADSGTSGERKKALQKIQQTLNSSTFLTEDDYSEIFKDISKTLFKRFSDDVEKCRELAFAITAVLFERSSNVLSVLAYFLPALMQRIPPTGAYDDDLKVFVVDIESHEAFKRGRAVDRQDKGDALTTHTVVEPSEEIRLLAVKCMAALVSKVTTNNMCSVLHPYFTEVIIFLESQLRDPFGDVRLVVCNVLCLLAEQPEFELGMKYYAVGLVRALLPVLRHKHAKLRCAAVDAIRCCVMVRDREKRKGAGTAAIQDLVGFREENVLQIAAFYKADIQINFLAEITGDSVSAVRERVAVMLSAFLTELEDRYDHQTRLLPYLLDLLTDDAENVSSVALKCLETCGRQYESEHNDEIIERRQYGVDGDNRINLDKPLPAPFKGRPRIGMRLYVRGNTKRFLNALLNELTNWISKTRVKSCRLLKVIVVMCEEHLSMEAYVLLPMFVKALGFANSDKDSELKSLLEETIELCGRYLAPDVYIHYILPRLVGDPEVAQFGADAATRISVMEVLRGLLSGTRPSQLPLHLPAIVSALVDPYVIDPESIALRSAALDVTVTLLRSLVGAGGSAAAAAIEAHFMSTGRLSSLQSTVRCLFKRLVVDLSEPVLNHRASLALLLLSSIEGGDALNNAQSMSAAERNAAKLKQMFSLHSASVLQAALSSDFEVFHPTADAKETDFLAECPDWSASDRQAAQLVARLLECPWCPIQSSPQAFVATLTHLSLAAEGAVAAGRGASDAKVLAALMKCAIIALRPLAIALLLGDGGGHAAASSADQPYAAFAHMFESAELCGGLTADSCFPPRAAFVQPFQALKSRPAGGSTSSPLSRVVSAFVLNSAWSADSVDQQRRRLLMASLLLLGLPADSRAEYRALVCASEGAAEAASAPSSSSSSLSTSCPLLPLELDDLMMDGARHSIFAAVTPFSSEPPAIDSRFLLHDAATLLKSVLAKSVAPGSPLDLRVRAIQLVEVICSLLVPEPQRKLVAFPQRLTRRRSLVQAGADKISSQMVVLESSIQEGALSGGMIDAWTEENEVIVPGPAVMNLLITALDDSSDDVRCLAMRAFMIAIQFVLPEASDFSVQIRSFVTEDERNSLTYRRICALLLQHVSIHFQSLSASSVYDTKHTEFWELLDTLLRSLACFNPTVFEQVVRVHLETLSASSTPSSDLISALSGLIQHCDVLMQFQSS